MKTREGTEQKTYVDDGILEHSSTDPTLKDGALASSPVNVFEEPACSFLVVGQLRSVVAFVKVLEHSGEDFRLFVRKVDAFARSFEELRPAGLSEVR